MRFTDDSTPDTHRLHDIAWAAVLAADPPFAVDEDAFRRVTEDYVRELSTHDAWTLELNHFARLHASLLDRLVKSGHFGPGVLYGWLHFPGRRHLVDLPSPVTFAQGAVAGAVDTFTVQTASELAEAFARVALAEAKSGASRPSDELLLSPFDVLLKAPGLNPDARFHARHHRAKTLKRLGRYSEAVDECDRLLEEAGPLPATRLLIARTLTEGFADDPKAGVRARQLLMGLLQDAAAAPHDASMSVSLAAAELLRRKAVHPDWAEVFSRYGGFLGEMIVRANERGLEQSILTLAGLAADWSEREPAAFVDVVHKLRVSPPDRLEEDDELSAWGEVYSSMAAAVPSARSGYLEAALSYFSRCARSYGMTHRAHTLTRLGRPQESLAVLDELVATYPRSAGDTWVLQRRAEALLELGDAAEALELSDRVVNRVEHGDRHFDYLWRVRARILDSVGRPEEARAAIHLAEQYRATNA